MAPHVDGNEASDSDSDESLQDEFVNVGLIKAYDESREAERQETPKADLEVKDDAARFGAQTWDQQWREVMGLLATGRVRWDESGNHDVPLLEDYMRRALTKRDPRDTMRPTLLHVLARQSGMDDIQGALPKDTLLKIIQYLLQHQESPPANDDTNEPKEEPILKLAMHFGGEDFIDQIIHCCKKLPGKLAEMVDATDFEETNCLHYIFKTQLLAAIEPFPEYGPSLSARPPSLRKTIEALVEFARVAKSRTIAATDKRGNTPIHYALNYRLCHRLPEYVQYVQIVRKLVTAGDRVFKKNVASQFNHEGQSPYLYFLQTREDYLKQQQAAAATRSTQSSAAATSQQKVDKQTERDIKEAKAPGSTGGGRIVDRLPEKDSKDAKPSNRADAGLKRVQDPPENTESKSKRLPPKPGVGEAPERLESPTAREPPPLPDKNKAFAPPKGLSDKMQGGREDSSSLGQNAIPRPLARSRTQNLVRESSAVRNEGRSSTTQSDRKPDSSSRSDEEFAERDKAASDIREFVKVHYIRTRTDMETKELLYGKVASDKNIYFDASDLRGKSVDQVVDLIGKLSKAGGFEDTLSYVYLPVLSSVYEKADASRFDGRRYGANERRQRGRTANENQATGRSALISVFDKLASVNVRTILRLHVDDRDNLSHSDAAIERAVRGRDFFSLGHSRNEPIHVEHWDWRKPDLSLDVIAFAAPRVAHVHLYWSGNQAVLRGWGSPEGISRYSGPRGSLKEVTLHVYPGLEHRDRTSKMIERFKDDIYIQLAGDAGTDSSSKKSAEAKKLKIETEIHTGTITSSLKSDNDLDTSEADTPDGPPHHVWVGKIEEFRNALVPIHTVLNIYPETPRVRVALIDDGVDLSNLDTYNDIVRPTGLSYYPPQARATTEKPWHQSTNDHGTIMANMITRVNPWISLDIMRIRDGVAYTPGGKARTIYADSAANAIEGAIIRGADIISMSWSIKKLAKKPAVVLNGNGVSDGGQGEKKSPEEIAVEALQTAIEKARSRNILMFCSAADDIQLLGNDSLPFSAAPDCIFRIGAALPKGQRDPTSEDVKTISYFFPGNQVAEAKNPRSAKPITYRDGSSVSTALAAGLASLILYCTKMMATYHREKTKGVVGTRADNVFAEWAEQLRNHKNMRAAFDNIESPGNEDKKFLPVWDRFGKATDRINEAQGEKKLAELDKLVRHLCHKFETE